MSRKEIHRNAHSQEYQEASDHQGFLELYKQARARIETLEQEKLKRTAKSKPIGRFIRNIRGRVDLLKEFDEALWVAVVENVTVMQNGGMLFRFKNGVDII